MYHKDMLCGGGNGFEFKSLPQYLAVKNF